MIICEIFRLRVAYPSNKFDASKVSIFKIMPNKKYAIPEGEEKLNLEVEYYDPGKQKWVNIQNLPPRAFPQYEGVELDMNGTKDSNFVKIRINWESSIGYQI